MSTSSISHQHMHHWVQPNHRYSIWWPILHNFHRMMYSCLGYSGIVLEYSSARSCLTLNPNVNVKWQSSRHWFLESPWQIKHNCMSPLHLKVWLGCTRIILTWQLSWSHKPKTSCQLQVLVISTCIIESSQIKDTAYDDPSFIVCIEWCIDVWDTAVSFLSILRLDLAKP